MKIQTNNAAATRRSINKVLNMVLNDDIDTKQANCIIYGCNVCLTAIKTIDLENRLEELEAIVDGTAEESIENL